MIYLAFLISLLYGFLILFLSKGIERLKTVSGDHETPVSSFSILIPFRNEELNLPELLESLNALDYPTSQFEILLINDASSDASESIIKRFKAEHSRLNISLLNNDKDNGSPKKKAIKKGIAMASFDWIITTDADCVVPESWLRILDKKIREQSPKMIVAPVAYLPKNGFLHHFQGLDFLSLQGITMGGFGMKDKKFGHPFLCNGANLCYSKESFREVNGFEGNDHIASGDDIFLLEKIFQKYPEKVQFIKSKEAIVLTSSKDSLKELIQQRVRWAAKTTAYDSMYTKLVGLLVFGMSLSLVILFFLGATGKLQWLQVGFIFLLKFNIDFVLLLKTSQFFEQQKVMKSYFLSSLLHPFFTVFVALLSLKKSYTWKDRTY
ncbi:MAG: glycosyltransferase [Flavobacteriales bacterium]|nr:glycosyltransferase [Flavobacteriales bacterium]